jgi:uncharacterized protein (DUF1697 family)
VLGLGHTEVAIYIQSGNVVFTTLAVVIGYPARRLPADQALGCVAATRA